MLVGFLCFKCFFETVNQNENKLQKNGTNLVRLVISRYFYSPSNNNIYSFVTLLAITIYIASLLS